MCDTDTHFILAFQTGNGPQPDVNTFRGLLDQASRRTRIQCIVADAGYDSEANHRFSRKEKGVRTVIPPRHGRPTSKPAAGRYRRLMQTRFDQPRYRKRSQVETTISMIKRRQGAVVRARTYWNRCRELTLMVLTHNIMILFQHSAIACSFRQSHSGSNFRRICWVFLLDKAPAGERLIRGGSS